MPAVDVALDLGSAAIKVGAARFAAEALVAERGVEKTAIIRAPSKLFEKLRAGRLGWMGC